MMVVGHGGSSRSTRDRDNRRGGRDRADRGRERGGRDRGNEQRQARFGGDPAQDAERKRPPPLGCAPVWGENCKVDVSFDTDTDGGTCVLCCTLVFVCACHVSAFCVCVVCVCACVLWVCTFCLHSGPLHPCQVHVLDSGVLSFLAPYSLSVLSLAFLRCVELRRGRGSAGRQVHLQERLCCPGLQRSGLSPHVFSLTSTLLFIPSFFTHAHLAVLPSAWGHKCVCCASPRCPWCVSPSP